MVNTKEFNAVACAVLSATAQKSYSPGGYNLRKAKRCVISLLLLFVAEKAALADHLRYLRWDHFLPALVPAGDALEHVPGKDRQIFRIEIIELDEAAPAYQVIIKRLQLGFHLERVDGL